MRLNDVHKLKLGQQVTVCEWRKGKPGVRRSTITPNWHQEYIGTVMKVTRKGGVLVQSQGSNRWQPYHAISPNQSDVQEYRWHE
jgi:hypothetical protein